MTAVDERLDVSTDLDLAREAIERAFGRTTELKPVYTPNSHTTFMLRYSRKDALGEPIEEPYESHWRVALNVSSVTVLYVDGADWQEGDTEPAPVNAQELDFPFRTIARQYNWFLANGRKLKEFTELVSNGLDQWLAKADEYYSGLLVGKIFVPNSPTWTGAGTPLGQLAACFVLPVADSLVAGESSIMKTLKDAVAIQKTGGGNGFSFGRLRPAKSRVSTSMGEATGVVGFLRMYNAVFEEIRQGGSRRGANMGVCPVWHPDVLEFIYAKTEEGQNANFNISVALTDDFMWAVKNNREWRFVFGGETVPVTWKGETVESIPARELFDLIVANAHILGDPGALFIDAANRDNPCPLWYVLESTNPCGEQWLGPYENCCLGSIAIQNFVREDATFDWDSFRKTVELSTEFLDDVVDANGYVPSVPELEVAAQGGRRIGLGQMGVADALYMMGLRYGSPEGLDFASQVTEFLRFHSMRASIRRAEQRGAFPRITQSIYDPQILREQGEGAEFSGVMQDGSTGFTANTWKRPVPKVKHLLDLGRPQCDWDEVFWGIVEHGIRNSCQTTFAPTGTIATTAGTEGYGCEPVFALNYTRKVMQEGQDIVLFYLSDLFEKALRKAGLNDEELSVVLEKVKANGGSCQKVEEVPEDIRHVFAVAADVTGTEHVWMQAVLQAFVDNSISKTINLPNEATVQDVADIYELAWQLECKGITIYRQGSRKREVLTTKAAETGSVEIVDQDHWPIIKPLPIPREAELDGLPSRTYTVRTPFGKMRATMTSLEDYPGRPFDVELGIGRGGSDVNAFTEALGRLASLNFRAGVDPAEVADQLIGIGGQTQEETLRPDKARSLPDAFGKLILRYITPKSTEVESVEVDVLTQSTEKAKGDPSTLCPKCHQYTMAMAEGCMTCLPNAGGCGYSKCGS